MKSNKFLRYVLIALFIIVFVVSVFYFRLIFGAPIKVKTNEYDVDLYIDGAMITKYKGDDKDIVIPDHIWWRPVFAIGEDCFSGNHGIETVVISNNVKYIKRYAFTGCDNLKSIEGGNIVSVEWFAFAYDYQLKKVELGDKLFFIGERAFARCTSLNYIPSKNSIRKIGRQAFAESGVTDPGDLSGVEMADDAFASEMLSE